MNLNETIYGNSYLLGRDVYINGEHRIENIAFDKYLRNLGLIDHSGPVHNLAVVWYEQDDEQLGEEKVPDKIDLDIFEPHQLFSV